MKSNKNILVIRFSSLGDLVTLEFTLRAIRFFFPDDNILFFTSKVGFELYKNGNYFNDFLIHQNMVTSILTLRQQSFDIVINLQCNKPSLLITSAIKKKLVLNKSYSILDKLFFRKPSVKSTQELLKLCINDQTKINHYFQIKDNTTIHLPTTPSIKPSTGNNIIAMSTGSSERWESKRWGIQNYLQLIQQLLNANFEIILVGSKLEAIDEKIILSQFPKIKSFVNQTSILELKNILKQANLYVGNDSGPTLIAAGVGTSTLTIFGSTDIKHRPSEEFYNGTHLYIKPSEKIKCHPCYKTKCPTHHECMNDIQPQLVYQKILDYFKNNSLS